MYYVYVIYSAKSGKLYKGITENIRERVQKHNAAKVRSTKNGVPWKLIHYQAFINKTDARREELFLKSGKGKERLKVLLENTLSELE